MVLKVKWENLDFKKLPEPIRGDICYYNGRPFTGTPLPEPSVPFINGFTRYCHARFTNNEKVIIDKFIKKENSKLIDIDNHYTLDKYTTLNTIDFQEQFNEDKFAEQKKKNIKVNKDGWDDMSTFGCIAWFILLPIVATLIFGLMTKILTLGL